MYLGRSAGSAQPLVWAHSEYIKLLRSVADGRVFDRISVVEERYSVPAMQRMFTNNLEIFQTARPIFKITAGLTLRILDTERFRVVWTADNWVTTNTIESRAVGYPGSFADIPTAPRQSGTILFTLYWPGDDRWLGKNMQVAVVAS
jgi:glucoamylase